MYSTNIRIGYKITDELTIRLRMSRCELEDKLEELGIPFRTTFERKESGYNETFMVIDELKIEAIMHNGFVVYLKSAATEYSILAKQDKESEVLDVLNEVIQKIKDMAQSNCSIKVEKLNADSLSIVASLDENMRIGIAKNRKGEVYLGTLRYLEELI